MAGTLQRLLGSVLSRFAGFNAGLPNGNGGNQKVGAIPLRGETPSTYQNNGTTVRVRGFERHPVVQACVRAIVDVAASIPLQATDAPPDQGGDHLETHPLQQLVDAPSPFLSSKRWRKLSLTHFLVYGNACNFIERTGTIEQQKGPPRGLRIVHPEDLSAVWVDSNGYPLYYQWLDTLGYAHQTPVTDLLHWRDLAAKGLVFGYPRAAAALNDIIGDDEASQHVRQVVTNYGAPNAYALTDPETTQEEAEQAEAKLYEKIVTRGNRGRFLFLGVKDIKTVGFSLRDLEFPDLRRVAREDICAAFGVDPRMIGIASATSDAGLSGVQYREARARLVQHTVEPLLGDFIDELNHWLTPEYGNVWLRVNPDALKALVEDDQATSTRVQGEVRAKLKTIEEGRVAIGMPEAYEPDDTLLLSPGDALVPTAVALVSGETGAQAGVAGSQALIDNGGAPPAPALPASTDGGAVDDDDEVDDEDRSSVRIHVTRRRVITAPAPRSLVLSRSVVLSRELRVLLWRQFDERAVGDEAAYRRQALMLMGEERQIIARAFERAMAERAAPTDEELDQQLAKGIQRHVRQMYKPDGDVEQRWHDRFHPLIGETFAKGASHIVDGVRSVRVARPKKKKTASAEPSGVSYDFHLQAIDVQQAVSERAKRLAKHVGRTTSDAINAAIVIGVRNSMSLPQIAELVDKTAFGASAGYRATLISRTETVGALNHGQFYAASESEAVEGKEWLTQGDDRVRDTHAECESMGVIELEAPFQNGLQHPGDQAGDAGDVINCRCTLLYYDTVTGD